MLNSVLQVHKKASRVEIMLNVDLEKFRMPRKENREAML